MPVLNKKDPSNGITILESVIFNIVMYSYTISYT